MYGKLIDGNFQRAPIRISVNNRIVTNPSSRMLEEAGYKKLVEEPVPEIPEGKTANAIYTEQDDSILQSWVLEDAPTVEESEEVDEVTLLKAQVQALSDRNDFMEDCIAEMAELLYA